MVLDGTFHKTYERGCQSSVLICTLENGLAVRHILSYI